MEYRPWRSTIQSISGVDPDIPVVSLNDPREVERVHFVLFNDDERRTLAWAVKQAENIQHDQRLAVVRTAWHQTVWGRIGIAAGLLAAIADIVLAIKAVIG